MNEARAKVYRSIRSAQSLEDQIDVTVNTLLDIIKLLLKATTDSKLFADRIAYTEIIVEQLRLMYEDAYGKEEIDKMKEEIVKELEDSSLF